MLLSRILFEKVNYKSILIIWPSKLLLFLLPKVYVDYILINKFIKFILFILLCIFYSLRLEACFQRISRMCYFKATFYKQGDLLADANFLVGISFVYKTQKIE